MADLGRIERETGRYGPSPFPALKLEFEFDVRLWLTAKQEGEE